MPVQEATDIADERRAVFRLSFVDMVWPHPLRGPQSSIVAISAGALKLGRTLAEANRVAACTGPHGPPRP